MAATRAMILRYPNPEFFSDPLVNASAWQAFLTDMASAHEADLASLNNVFQQQIKGFRQDVEDRIMQEASYASRN